LGDSLDIQPNQLQAALARTPTVRADVVARGLQLATDPNYPSNEIIHQVASLIMKSPDLSETQD
jgi:hypothetical protein